MKEAIMFFSLFILYANLLSQEQGILHGKVYDDLTREALEGTTIGKKGVTFARNENHEKLDWTTSQLDGSYSFKLDTGRQEIAITYLGSDTIYKSVHISTITELNISINNTNILFKKDQEVFPNVSFEEKLSGSWSVEKFLLNSELRGASDQIYQQVQNKRHAINTNIEEWDYYKHGFYFELTGSKEKEEKLGIISYYDNCRHYSYYEYVFRNEQTIEIRKQDNFTMTLAGCPLEVQGSKGFIDFQLFMDNFQGEMEYMIHENTMLLKAKGNSIVLRKMTKEKQHSKQ